MADESMKRRVSQHTEVRDKKETKHNSEHKQKHASRWIIHASQYLIRDSSHVQNIRALSVCPRWPLPDKRVALN